MQTASRQWLVLFALLALCLTVGSLGGIITARSVGDWYLTINRPPWNPPAFIFAPVWTVLYFSMAVAAWLVWKRDRRFAGVRLALVFFFIQLALNFLWPFVFFGAHAIGAALFNIALLWIALALTVWAFFGVSRLAGVLMLPYLAWVSFASFLNFAIWQLN